MRIGGAIGKLVTEQRAADLEFAAEQALCYKRV